MAVKKPKTGLGRGFDSLLPSSFDTTILVDEGERVQKLAVDIVKPNPDQPRRTFDEQLLQELADSIRQYGIVQPLVASPHPDQSDGYVIVAGERRWRAAQLAGLKHVPVIVRTNRELEQLEIALIENVQRVDLSALEQAVSIERLHQHFNSSYDAIAKRLGKANSTINNIVRLLQLPEAAKQALAAGKISEGHARQILALKDTPDHQVELLKQIVDRGWSVRQAEQYVTAVKQGATETTKAHAKLETETPATQALAKRLATPVRIKRTAKGGRLEISFKDDDHLERLLGSFGK